MDEKKAPKIVFEQWQLQIAIGQWLHMDSSQSLEEIEKKFSYVLKLAGIQTTETCILKDFDKDAFSFHCYLKNTNKDADIELKWGDIHTPKEFVIHYPNQTIVYEYYQDENNIPTLKLRQYTIKNSLNKNTCSRTLSPYQILLTLQDEKNYLYILINQEKTNIEKNSSFILKNEAQLQKYLLELSFPLEMNEIYKKICEMSIDRIEDYPKFQLQIERKIDNKNRETTNMLSLTYGKLENFIVTRNGKTITINEKGDISHKTPTCIISEKENGEIHYSLNVKSGSKLPEEISPLKQYNEAQKEITKAKELIKIMFNKR